MKGSGLILPRFYRNFALGFFVIGAAILTFVAYLIWANVTVIIHPAKQISDYHSNFIVKPTGALALVQGQEGVVNGKINQINVTGEQAFQSSGREVLSADSGVIGQVIVINNYSKDQTLVATTRLTNINDPETVLARLKNTVVVPAGAQVEVQVYTEDPANFKKLQPQKFIIPGLWQPLWEKIYAENQQTLEPAEQIIGVVTEEDLVNAKEEIKKSLYQQALGQINEQLEPPETLWPKLINTENSEVSFDASVGDQVDEFLASMQLAANVVVFDEEQVISLARSSLGISDAGVINIDPKTFSYTIDEINLENNTASVSVDFQAAALTEASSDFLDKSQLFGKTEEEVKAYFSQFPEVESVEVIFSPVWLKKTPRIADKIKIEIQ